MMKPEWIKQLTPDWRQNLPKKTVLAIEEYFNRHPEIPLPSKFHPYRSDILSYGKNVLKVRWWEKQQEVALSVMRNKYTIVTASFGVGKTYVAGGIVNWFFDSFNPSITLTTAPTWSQVELLLWSEISNQRPLDSGGYLYTTRIKDTPKHFAIGLSTDKEARFQGFHEERLLVVIDEASEVRPAIWDAAVDNIPTGPDNRILAIGNPLQKSGPFYAASKDADWNHIHISSIEHPNILAELEGQDPPYPKAVRLEWLAKRIERWCILVDQPEVVDLDNLFMWPPGSGNWYLPNALFQAKALGWFPDEAVDQLIPLIAVEESMNREVEIGRPVRIGVDVGRGGDESIITIVQGLRVLPQVVMTVKDVMAVANKTKESINRYHADTCRIDSIGIGAGVYDRLCEMKAEGQFVCDCKLVPVNVGEVPREVAGQTEVFFNLRSQCWWNMRDLISQLQLPKDEQLQSELISPTWHQVSRGKIEVERKESLMSRGVKSPNRAESLMLALADFIKEEKLWKRLKFINLGAPISGNGSLRVRANMGAFPLQIMGPVSGRHYVFRTGHDIIELQGEDVESMLKMTFHTMQGQQKMFRVTK